MSIRLYNLPLDLDESEEMLRNRAAERMGIAADSIRECKVSRRSVDCRRKKPRFVYSVDVEIEGDEAAAVKGLSDAVAIAEEHPEEFRLGSEPLPSRPIVVGAGPAGLFSALRLAKHGYKPLLIERGKAVPDRLKDVRTLMSLGELNPESNWLFGAGGAGTFSDGKLQTGITDRRIPEVLRTFRECGAPDDILYDARPHVGTDRLRAVIMNLTSIIELYGGEIRYSARLDDLDIQDGQIRAGRVEGERIECSALILAIGHSARDTYRMLHERGVVMAPKPFQLGLRIEHPQELIDRGLYGEHAGHPRLGAASYVMVSRGGEGMERVASFCVCPGGVVVPAVSEAGTLCTNGMSRRKRDSGFCNGALVVTAVPTHFGDGPLDGVAFQLELERKGFELGGGDFRCPAQAAPDFMRGEVGQIGRRTTYPLGVTPANLADLMPERACRSIALALEEFDKRLEGFAGPEAILLGPETRGSAPLRILRKKETLESVNVSGLYPAGEGAGYAGGIMSSAVDGMRTAEGIMARYAPPVA